MRTIRLTTVLDDSGEVRIPVPPDFHAGDTVQVEVSLHQTSTPPHKSWAEWLDSVEGIFEGTPLELPHDPPPEPVNFEG